MQMRRAYFYINPVFASAPRIKASLTTKTPLLRFTKAIWRRYEYRQQVKYHHEHNQCSKQHDSLADNAKL